MVGEGGIGKTSIIHRYVHRQFSDNIQVTIGTDFFIKNEEYEGRNIKLKVWDTSGQ